MEGEVSGCCCCAGGRDVLALRGESGRWGAVKKERKGGGERFGRKKGKLEEVFEGIRERREASLCARRRGVCSPMPMQAAKERAAFVSLRGIR